MTNYTEFLGVLSKDIPAAVSKNVGGALDFYNNTLNIVLNNSGIVVDCVPRSAVQISYADWLLDCNYNEFEMKVKTIACYFVGLLQIQNQSIPKQQLTMHRDGVSSPNISRTAKQLSRVCLPLLNKWPFNILIIARYTVL